MSEIVGRDEELASLRAFIGQAEGEPTALVLEGQAGIGKSTLWLAGVEFARSRGLRVLSSRPAEAERGLAYAVLNDLLEDVLEDVLPSLAAPRRRALEIALLLEEADETTPSTRARSGSRLAARCSSSPKTGRCSSRSTTCSGSTRRRRQRWRSRCEGWRRTR